MHLKAGWICAVLLMTGTVALQGCRNLPDGGNEAAEATAETLLTPAPDLPKPWVSPIDLSEKTELLDFEYVIPPEVRKSAGQGKGVSGRVDLGGRRIIKKKK